MYPPFSSLTTRHAVYLVVVGLNVRFNISTVLSAGPFTGGYKDSISRFITVDNAEIVHASEKDPGIY